MNQMYDQEVALDMTSQAQYVNEVMVGQPDIMSLCGDSVGSPDPFDLLEEYIEEQLKRNPSHGDTDSAYYSSDNQSGFTSDESCDPPSPTGCSPMWSNGSMGGTYPIMQHSYSQDQVPHQGTVTNTESHFQHAPPEPSYPISVEDPWLNAPFCDINEMASWVVKQEEPSVISFPSSYEVVNFSSTMKDRKWNTNLSQEYPKTLDYPINLSPRDVISSPEPSLSDDEASPEPEHTRELQHPRKRRNSPGDKTATGRKGLQLWQFLLQVLQDDRYNPELIRWVDPDKGIFKFVQSQKVAKLWGQKRAKTNMSYEYLSRALRYYYSRGIMTRIAGKRLVYQFGSNAYGWKNQCPLRH